VGSRRLYYDRQSYDNVNVIPSLFVFSAAPTSYQHPPATLLLLLPSIHHDPSSSIHHHSSYLLFSKNPLKKKMVPRTYVCCALQKKLRVYSYRYLCSVLFLQSLLSLLFSLGRLFSVLLSFSNVLSICFRTIRTEKTLFSHSFCARPRPSFEINIISQRQHIHVNGAERLVARMYIRVYIYNY
jgi:hypothetical protein